MKTLEVSEGRKRACFYKLNTKGYEHLDDAELAVITAYDRDELIVLPDSYTINGQKIGAFFQRACSPDGIAREKQNAQHRIVMKKHLAKLKEETKKV